MEIMKRGIVITTSEYTKDFLKPLMESLKGVNYPILLVCNGGYEKEALKFVTSVYDPSPGVSWITNEQNEWELGGIRQGAKMFDEFVHLMDTTLIKDITLFDELFKIPGHVVLTKGNYHYMGKFVSKDLPNPLPITLDKEHAIQLEMSWLPKPYTEFEPDLPVHTQIFTEIHGQTRMVLSNQYMTKYKGTFRL